MATTIPAPALDASDNVLTPLSLLRLIDARESGRIGGPSVDIKIAELTARFGVVVTSTTD